MTTPRSDMSRLASSIALVLMIAVAGCSGAVKRPYTAVTADELLAMLEQRNGALRSYRAESKMDYRVAGDRVKGTVLIAARMNAFLRINAENPSGGSVAVDLACDGANYAYVNNNEDCYLAGACTEQAIAQLLRVRLEPDHFALMALGGIPLIPHDGAEVHWDDDRGRERLVLEAADGRVQTIELSGDSQRRWDVLFAKQTTPDGKTDWKLQNKDFSTVQGADGSSYRVPGKSLFEQPAANADLLVEWKKREINVELADAVFELAIPDGLRRCGSP